MSSDMMLNSELLRLLAGGLGSVKVLGVRKSAPEPLAETDLHRMCLHSVGVIALRAFLEQHRDEVNTPSSDGSTPLHCAVHARWVDGVEILLEFGADVLAAQKESRRTPLHLAAHSNAFVIVLALLSYAAGRDDDLRRDPNLKIKCLLACDSDGRTSLHIAAREGSYASAALLLQYGATAMIEDAKGHTPIYSVAKSGDATILSLLLQHCGAGACIAANLARTKVLVVGRRNKVGWTALDAALDKGQRCCVTMLLVAGARGDLANANGVTAIDRAKGSRDSAYVLEWFAHMPKRAVDAAKCAPPPPPTASASTVMYTADLSPSLPRPPTSKRSADTDSVVD